MTIPKGFPIPNSVTPPIDSTTPIPEPPILASEKADESVRRRGEIKPKIMSMDETSFILRRCLIPQHREDPNVLRFIKAYLNCRSVKQAAQEAGIKTTDGNALRRRPDIHHAICEITEKAVFKQGFDASEVVARVREVMEMDPIELQNEDGSFKENLHEIPAEYRRAIKRIKAKNIYALDANGIKYVEGKLIEVEFFDKMKAVELLGREKNLFTEKHKVEHNITANMSSVLLESKKRAEEANKERDVNTIDIEVEE